MTVSSRWLAAGSWALALLAVGIATQDLTGCLAGHSHALVFMDRSQSDPEVVRLKLPAALPQDLQLRRQTRVWQDGRRLRGPYRNHSAMRDAGEGSFLFGNALLVRPFGDASSAEQQSFRMWIPRGIPSPVRWLVYGLAAFFLLLPAIRRRLGQPPAEAKKLRCLESVRGLACLTVVACHFANAFYPALGTESMQDRAWNDPEWWYEVTPFANLLRAGPLAVNVFFILSGLVLYLPYCHGPAASDPARLRIAFLKRPVRLWGVMAAVMLAVQFLNWGGWPYGAYYAPPKDTATFLQDLFLQSFAKSTEYNAVFWTIRIELIGSFGVYLFAWLAGGSRWRPAAYAVIFFLIRDNLYVDFLLGMILAEAMPIFLRGQEWKQRRWLAVTLLAVGLVLACYPCPGDRMPLWCAPLLGRLPDLEPLLGGGYGTVAGLLLISAVLLSSTLQRALNHRWLIGMGRLSYAAYGVHGVVLGSAVLWFMSRIHPPQAEVKFAFNPDGFSYHLAAAGALVFYLGLVWLASAALTVFVDEPCTRFSGKLARWLLVPSTPAPNGKTTDDKP